MGKSEKKDFRFGIDSSSNGLDMNRILISHPSSTFFMRIDNDIDQLDLKAGDILIVDRSLNPKQSDNVVVFQDGEADMQVIEWSNNLHNLQVWGVCTHIVRELKP